MGVCVCVGVAVGVNVGVSVGVFVAVGPVVGVIVVVAVVLSATTPFTEKMPVIIKAIVINIPYIIFTYRCLLSVSLLLW
jgi:hypothetical protein